MENTLATNDGNMLKVFENGEFSEVRVIMRDGEPWFVASDVAKNLGYRMASDMTRRLDDDEKGTHSMRTPGGEQEVSVVTEAGLYNATLSSKVPRAKAFKRWITHEVVPSIRKTGGYITGQEQMTDTELLAQAVLVAQKQIQLRDERIAALHQEKVALETTITEQKPLVDFASTIQTAHESVSMNVTARMLSHDDFKISRNKLFQILRGKHILMSGRCPDEWNLPRQQYVDAGYFEVETNTYTGRWGETSESFTTKVTPKGQMWIANNIRKWMKDVCVVA